MPEGPEILRQIDWLTQRLKVGGKWLEYVGASKFGTRFNDVDLRLTIPSITLPIVDVFAKGKEMFIRLANDITIRCHHRMEGHWALNYEPNAHFKLVFGEDHEVEIYCANSRFGEFEILTNAQQLQESLDRLAPGFIGRFILSEDEWCARLRTFTDRKSLRALLLSQSDVCSGIGNYLWSEIIYRARLHPTVTLKDLRGHERELYWTIRETVQGMYDGTDTKLVYKRETDPYGRPVERLTQSGRTTWWVPSAH